MPLIALQHMVLVALAFSQSEGQSSVQVPDNLTLSEAQQILVQYNPRIQAERLNRELEVADLDAARRFANPVLELTTQGLGSPGPGNPFNDQEFSALVGQEFWTGGKRKKRMALEQSELEIAEIFFENSLRVLGFNLKQAYYQLVLAQKDELVSREILGDFQDLVRLNQIRFEAGEISGGELRRVEAAQYSFYEDLVGAEVAVENAQDELLAVLGASNLQQRTVATDDFAIPSLPGPLDELRQVALRQRRDLAAQRALLVRAQRLIEVEQSLRTPSFLAFGGYRRDFGINGAIMGVEIPLQFFNRNQGGIARALVTHRQQQQRIRQFEVEVLRQVEVAYNELEGNRRRIQALEGEYLDKAEQSRSIAEESYRLGSASLMELLEAQRTYREIRRRYNGALYDRQLSQFQLELAVGQDF